MEQLPLVPIDMPATYRICELGGLESSWAKHLWGMTTTPVKQAGEREQALLAGKVTYQAALVGKINALYNMDFAVVPVEGMPPTAHIPTTLKE